MSEGVLLAMVRAEEECRIHADDDDHHLLVMAMVRGEAIELQLLLVTVAASPGSLGAGRAVLTVPSRTEPTNGAGAGRGRRQLRRGFSLAGAGSPANVCVHAGSWRARPSPECRRCADDTGRREAHTSKWTWAIDDIEKSYACWRGISDWRGGASERAPHGTVSIYPLTLFFPSVGAARPT